jgi:hypothetical protein
VTKEREGIGSMLLKTAWVVILIDDEDTHRAVGQIGVLFFMARSRLLMTGLFCHRFSKSLSG